MLNEMIINKNIICLLFRDIEIAFCSSKHKCKAVIGPKTEILNIKTQSKFSAVNKVHTKLQ